MNMAADPVLTIAQGQTIDVKVAVTRCESRLRFVCAWDDLDQRLDLTVIGPDGTIFTPNSPNSNRLVSYVTQPGYAFYNLAVPPLDDSDRIAPLVIGTWTMRVGTTHLQTAQERFTTSLVVDTEIEMVTHVNPAATAAASQIAVTILHAGIPVPGAEVKIVFGAPTISAQGLICKSRGALIFPPSELDHLGPRVPPGRVPPGRRSRRAASAPQARSAKALSPRSAKNAVRIPMKNTTLTARLNEEFNYAANLPRFVRDGIYQLVVQATVPACGGTVTRYGNFAFVPFQLLSGRMSVISVAAAPGVGKAVSVRITPRDDAGNLVGLGLAAKFKIEVPRNVTLIRVTDRFDGSYDLLLGRHRAAPAKIKLRLGDRQIAIAIPAKPKKKHPPKHRERSRSR